MKVSRIVIVSGASLAACGLLPLVPAAVHASDAPAAT
jgi:hypothetical protein